MYSKKSESKTKDSVSYSEDFEDEKSIPLTQSAAYQKMLNTVDVSDEDEDLERDFLEGNVRSFQGSWGISRETDMTFLTDKIPWGGFPEA